LQPSSVALFLPCPEARLAGLPIPWSIIPELRERIEAAKVRLRQSPIRDLDHRLPKGFGVQKGIYPDYTKMTASTPLWRNSEGPCPTGGRATVDLQWHGDRIALRGLRIEKHDWGC
jgi:hypothetical protein